MSFVILTEHSCGYLTVLEDRSKPEGRTIRLFVIRVRPPGGSTTPDPMLHGGVELATTADYGGIAPLAQRTHRELIILDQRGAAHSQPSLACPEVRAVAEQLIGAPMSEPSARAGLRSAASDCYDRLVREGIDPAAYTLEAAAADIEDLRRTLGIDRWNIQVHGTASRIVLESMRRFPKRIRSVVLDTPQFPQLDGLTAAPDDLHDAMHRLSAVCAEQVRCHEAFPELVDAFDEAAARLQGHPVTVRVEKDRSGLDHPVDVVVDGAAFVRGVRVMLSDQDLGGAPLVPAAVHAALDGDVRLVARFLAEDPGWCVGYLPKCERYDFSEGTYYSFVCHDEVPFIDEARLDKTSAGNPGIAEAYGRSPMLDVCDVWPVGAADATAQRPMSSDIPALILYGAFDAYSPRALAETGAGLTSAFPVSFPFNGHNMLAFDCPRRLRNGWVDDPASPPDTSCIDDEMPAPHFEVA
ncbi:MAG TPA: alpha/beta fold hydrolase [Actinomycetota bacterium]|nr:alpha/beta fold hydrolase [Actinomycetota bacterium]